MDQILRIEYKAFDFIEKNNIIMKLLILVSQFMLETINHKESL